MQLGRHSKDTAENGSFFHYDIVNSWVLGGSESYD